MRGNVDPYYNGDWRRAPYEARPYAQITDYEIPMDSCEEADLLRWKIQTRSSDRIVQDFYTDHVAALGPVKW